MNRGQLSFVVLILVGLPICALELSTAHLSARERQCSLREWPLHCLYGGHNALNPPSRPPSCQLRLRGGGFHKGRKIRKLNNWKPKHKQVGENPLQVERVVFFHLLPRTHWRAFPPTHQAVALWNTRPSFDCILLI